MALDARVNSLSKSLFSLWYMLYWESIKHHIRQFIIIMTSNNTTVLPCVEIEENNQQVIERPITISQNLNAPPSFEDVEEPPPCEEDVEEPTSPKEQKPIMLQSLVVLEKFVELTPISKNLCKYLCGYFYFLLCILVLECFYYLLESQKSITSIIMKMTC